MKESKNKDSLNLDGLDSLIEKYVQHFKDKIDEKAKIGDLLKMIELRRKLSPENSDQKKFWKMINKIRNKNLKSENNDLKLQEKNEK